MVKKKKQILLVDDEPNFLRTLKDALELEGFAISVSENGLQALQLLQQTNVDVVITDIRMPKMTGMELLKQIKNSLPQIIVFVLTGYGSIQDAVQSVKIGAENYILKPVNVKDLIDNIHQAFKRRENRMSDPELSPNGFSMIGNSQSLQQIRSLLPKIASSELSVLITGESGTGKELVANAIYQHSNRKEQAFLKINCAALPEHLLESELFGYEPGAFTDAKKIKRGKLELAHCGTLFLDEIGDMSVAMQAKLLRVLEEKRVVRLGGNRTIPTDFRLLSATNQNLQSLIASGRFREDLYFRMNTFHIQLPPLREIIADIPLLSEYFLQGYCAEQQMNPPQIYPETMTKMMLYSWPGNVRELRNVIQRAVVLCGGKFILPEQLPFLTADELDQTPKPSLVAKTLDEMEREHILRVLKITGGNKNRTATILNIHRDTLYRKLRKYHIEL